MFTRITYGSVFIYLYCAVVTFIVIDWGLLCQHSDITGEGINRENSLLKDKTISINNILPDLRVSLGIWLNSWEPAHINRFQALVNEKVSMEDARLIKLARNSMIPPSAHRLDKFARWNPVFTRQAKAAFSILRNKKGGFFIEAGALDGEHTSNTAHLEKYYGWNGLLVEMDPFYYLQILGKSRHSFSLNACLSPNTHPIMVNIREDSGPRGQVLSESSNERDFRSSRTVPCFPLFTLLQAINVTKVDFFSLDVEGLELDVLKTIPFDKVDISVLAVEYVHGKSGPEAYKTFMIDKGYELHSNIVFHDHETAQYIDDFIFVKKGLS